MHKDIPIAVAGDAGRALALLNQPAWQCKPGLVILLQGTGAYDINGTNGRSRLTFDLAHGLAGHGLASLRCEKKRLTSEHLQYGRFHQEYLDPVLAAVRTVELRMGSLQKVIIAHSFAGRVAPLLAERMIHVKGIAVLAGHVSPLRDVVAFQYRQRQSAEPIMRSGWDLLSAQYRADLEQEAAIDLSQTTCNRSYPMFIVNIANDQQIPNTEAMSWAGLCRRPDDVVLTVLNSTHGFTSSAEAPGRGEFDTMDANLLLALTHWIKKQLDEAPRQ